MRQIIKTTVIFLLLTSTLLSQKIIFINQSGDRVEGVQVYFNDSLLLTQTSFINAPDISGSYELTAVSGVLRATKQVLFPLQNDLQIELSPFIESEVVVVKGTQTTDEMPFTAKTLNQIELEKTNFNQDVPFLLRKTPSVVATSDAGAGVGYTAMRIRGTDQTRINITINGVPLNDPESHQVFWVNTPDLIRSAEDVQIQRGVGTSTNGGAAFGASIHLNLDNKSAKPEVNLSQSIGSFNTFGTSASLSTGLIDNRFIAEGRISYIQSDGYIDRGSSDLRSTYLFGKYILKNGAVRAYYFSGDERTYQAWNGVPISYVNDEDLRTYNSAGTEKKGTPYEDQVDDYGQDHFQLHWDHQWGKLRSTISAHYTKGKGFFELYQQNEDLSEFGLLNNTNTSDIVERRWLDNDFFGGVWAAEWNSDRVNLQFGGAINQYRGLHFGELIWVQSETEIAPNYRYYEDDAIKNDRNLYLKTTYHFNTDWYAYLDLQYRDVSHEFIGIADDRKLNWGFLNPKVGLTKLWSNLEKSYFSFAVAQREPNRNDLITSIVGNEPHPEKLYNIELGHQIGAQNNKWGLQANAYLMYYQDQLVLTGELNDVGASIKTNVDQSYRLGVELDGFYEWRKWTFSGNMTWSRNRILNHEVFVDDWDTGTQIKETYENSPISFSPSFIGFFGLNYAFFPTLYAGLQFKYISRQYLDNTGNKLRSLDPYSFTDFQINWNPKGILKPLSVSFTMQNLFNQFFETNGWVYRFAFSDPTIVSDPYTESEHTGRFSQIGLYPQAGRNLMLKVAFNF